MSANNKKAKGDSLKPRKAVKRLVKRAANLTNRSKTYIYEQCVAAALGGKSAEELRQMLRVDQVETLSQKPLLKAAA